MDIDGRQGEWWGYVMPNLAYPLILGRPWMERNKMIYLAGQQSLRKGRGDNESVVKTSGWLENLAPHEVQEGLMSAKLRNGSEVSIQDLICP